jgi:hypothetical protein
MLAALNGKPIIYIIQRALCGLFELWALLFMTFILSCVYITQTTRLKKLRRSRFFSFSLLLIPIIYTVADAIIVIYQSSAPI